MTRQPEPVPTVPSRRRNLVTVGVLLGVVALGLAAGRWITTAAPFVDTLEDDADVRLVVDADGRGLALVLRLRDLLVEPDAPEVARLTLSSVALLGETSTSGSAGDTGPDVRGLELDAPAVCAPGPGLAFAAGEAGEGPCGSDRRAVSGARVASDDVLVLPLGIAAPARGDEVAVCVTSVRLRFRDGVRTGDQRVAVDRCVGRIG